MLFSSELINQLGPAVAKTVVGLVLSGVLGLLYWPVRKMRTEWTNVKEHLEATHKELVQQRTNCLTTLQSQGVTQIQLLEKTVDLLQELKVGQAEQTGYLAGSTPRLRVRRAAAKK